MTAWLRVGSKRLGYEFAYIFLSAIFMVAMHSQVILAHREDFTSWDRVLFYGVFLYNVVTYVSLAFSDPGRIDPLQRKDYGKQLDYVVRQLLLLMFSSTS
jgi:uncharacterized membrane protein